MNVRFLQFQNMAHFLPTEPSYKLSHMHIIINDDGDGLLYKPNKHSNVHSIDLIILSMFLWWHWYAKSGRWSLQYMQYICLFYPWLLILTWFVTPIFITRHLNGGDYSPRHRNGGDCWNHLSSHATCWWGNYCLWYCHFSEYSNK